MAHARLGPHDHGCLQCVELATSRDDLLAALEAIMPLAQTGFSALARREQGGDSQAVLRAARAAIESAKGA